MKKILITGGSGFIGSSVRKALCDPKFEILTVGRNEKEDFKIDLIDPRLKTIVEDFLPDTVCHFASGSNILRATEDAKRDFDDTVVATDCLITALKTLKSKSVKIVYLSSQAVYGLPKYLPVDEAHQTKPVTVYGEHKLRAENIIAQSNLNYLIFRVSSVFGPNQNHKKSGVIAKFIHNMQNNQPPIVFNSFDLVCDLIYISDLVNAVVKATLNDLIHSEVFNLGSGKAVTLKQVLDILYKYFPAAPEPRLEINPLYLSKEQKGMYLDIKKIQAQLQWTLKYNTEDGIKETLADIKLTEKV